jgi:maltose alpha-D-glucosyltransferase/alpha-amylase
MGSNIMSDETLWYMNAVFYELNVRAFFDCDSDGIGDLQGITQKLDYLVNLGVNVIWLLPIYPSPLKDDGYDIADYYSIHPDYGNLDDFKALINAAHKRGMRVVTDLVLNHTSDQHTWFQEARKGSDNPYHDYYVWSDSDRKYPEARIIFLDTESSNWAWDESAQQYYWHRFYSSQPDLNFDNPNVREEIFKVAKFWLDLGVDGFRADAVPYLFQREGTNCENLPETHAYLKELRGFIDKNYPDRVLLCEANQWPMDVRDYFGDGNEFHMAFHFPLMPRIYMAIGQGDASPLIWVMDQTPPIPKNTQWSTFLRNHDELTLEMVTEEERQWMWEQYAPDPRMRLNLGIRRRLAPLLENNRRKIELAYSLLFTLPGSPVIYYGDEIGMGDNIWLDDRNGVRTPMQWDSGMNAGFSSAPGEELFAPLIDEGDFDYRTLNVQVQDKDPNSLLNWIRKHLQIRKKYPVLGRGKLQILPSTDKSILLFLRQSEDQSLLIVNNLSTETRKIYIDLNQFKPNKCLDLINDEPLPISADKEIHLELPEYGYRWIKLETEG